MTEAGVWSRISKLEEDMRTNSDALIRHLAICEQLQRQAVERDAEAKATRDAMMCKLDKLMTISIEQRGAIKYGKALYAIIGAVGAAGVWLATHSGVVK